MKRTKLVLALAAVAATSILAGCGDPVTIPPAHVGKLNTPAGLQDGIVPPSTLRLSSWCVTCDKIVLLETADRPISDSAVIFMPKDRLNLTVDVRGTVSISSDEGPVNQVFARITAIPVAERDRVSLIPFNTVYKTYAEPVIRESIRSVLTSYTIAEVMTNRDAISAELAAKIRERLKNSPITLLQIGLANIQPPPIIVQAQEQRKEREIAIQKAEADARVRLTEAERALAVAAKQQEVDLLEAETQVLVNKKLAESVNNAFVTQRMIKVLMRMAESDNKVFIIPSDALANPAMLLGVVREGVK